MQRARRAEQPEVARGAVDFTASRTTPLTIVSGAVAGDDLERVAGTAAAALGQPVAIALAGAGVPVLAPAGALSPDELRRMFETGHAVPIRMGEELVGSVAAAGPTPSAEDRAWLEAAAIGAAVSMLMRSTEREDLNAARRAVLEALRLGPPRDVRALVATTRRLGVDPSRDAVALCTDGAAELVLPGWLLVARMRDGRVLGLVHEDGAEELGALLPGRVAASAPRRDASVWHEALAEAELLFELPATGAEDTYRLLIGVLLRDPNELEQLLSGTIAPLAAYDERHATELLATLECFLAHDGSTTEAAEAMNLHRHTIGYRLARVHEVSGLSPHESAGRERLGLGIKARQILEAYRRRMTRL